MNRRALLAGIAASVLPKPANGGPIGACNPGLLGERANDLGALINIGPRVLEVRNISNKPITVLLYNLEA